jgi:CRISPR-associated protein Cmr2
MTLLLVSVGPVQEFIAQARRTRDLWYGSHLLSELARAAARHLVAPPVQAQLVFPALGPEDPELAPCPGLLRSDGRPPLGIPNKIVALLPAGVDGGEAARGAREAVYSFWRHDLAEPVRGRLRPLLQAGSDALWDEQVAAAVEFLATWADVEAAGGYAAARREAEATLAARKNLREFLPWGHSLGGPMSSLDGAREGVLGTRRGRAAALARQYRIADGEQLDAVGLVRRAGGDPRQFVSVVNVGLAPWLQAAEQRAGEPFAKMCAAAQARGWPAVFRQDLPVGQLLAWSADLVLPSRWRPVFLEQGWNDEDAETWGQCHVRPLLRKMPEPFPYVACLAADGDHMGRTIDALAVQGPQAQRRLSRALSAFAAQVRDIVEQQHTGVLVYSGGDDVLAFLPLTTALACAVKLREAFVTQMRGLAPGEGPCPTLSVGVAVAHVMEGMGDLVELAREAERLAKGKGDQGRDALAVLVDRRSGGRRAWRARWETAPVARLQEDMALLRGDLPAKKLYELHRLWRRLPQPGAAGDDGDLALVLRGEVQRILARTDGGRRSLRPADVGLVLPDAGRYTEDHRILGEWVERLLVARVFVWAEIPPPSPRGGD